MRSNEILKVGATALALLIAGPGTRQPVFSQEQAALRAADADAAASPEPLSADELEVLVARIALYPDELIAVISGASLYPLQIVEAARYLDDYAKDKTLKPKENWDGSVVSLLNYPDVVKMMSDDLEWTQQLGDALAYQQKDVLIAIQQLRDEAVAKDIIKTDDKMKVETANDNIIIQSANQRADLCAALRAGDALRAELRRGADQLLSRSVPKLLVSDRNLLCRGGNRCDLGRGGRLGRLGRVGRQLGRRRHRHRLR